MMNYDKICCSGYQLARMLRRTQKRMINGHPGPVSSSRRGDVRATQITFITLLPR